MKDSSQKIVLISNSFGSLYNFRYELICVLLEKYQVTLLTPMEEADYERYEGLKAKGCRLIETPFRRRGKNPLSEIALYRRYLRLLKETAPALVLTYTIKPNVYAGMACRKLQIPYMSSVTGLGTAFQKNGPLKWMAVRLYRMGLKKAVRVFLQNQDSLDVLAGNGVLHGNEVLIAGSGINLDTFPCYPYEERYAKSFYYIARIMREKGAEEFLEVAAKMKKKYPDAQFHVIGFCEDAYEMRIHRMEAEGLLTYHGWQDNMQPFFQKAGCVIQPSHHEGMSNVCLEAAACGRPLIVSDIPGCREAVEDGKNGYLFPVTDAEALYRKTERFYLLPVEEKEAMGKYGREKMSREFDRKKVVERYLTEISGVLQEQRPENKI